MNDFEEGEFVPISIANIPSLLSLEELDYSPGEDLKIFLGEEIRPKLQNLSISSIDSNLSHLYHHLPCLQVLYLGESNDGDNIFRVIPPSLRKLRSTAFILEDIRDLDIKDVIYLTSITMDDCDDLDYSILPFVPASIEVLELRCNDMEILVEALQSVQAGELKFGGLRVSEYLPGNLSEQDKNNQWDRVLKECNRLGIGLEKVVS